MITSNHFFTINHHRIIFIFYKLIQRTMFFCPAEAPDVGGVCTGRPPLSGRFGSTAGHVTNLRIQKKWIGSRENRWETMVLTLFNHGFWMFLAVFEVTRLFGWFAEKYQSHHLILGYLLGLQQVGYKMVIIPKIQ